MSGITQTPAAGPTSRIVRGAGRLVTACAIVVALCGADWRQFRGNDSDGLAAGGGPRSLEKTAWSTPLSGRGISGPIVVGDRVIVTSSTGHEQDRLHVLAFATSDGAVLWDRQFWATGRTQCHPKMAVATPTPASDGNRIAAFYSSNDLACLDRDGNLLWFRGLTYDFPKASNSLGMSSSPVIVDDTVVVQVETDDDSFAMGLDVETGRSRWKLARPHHATWTSPVVLRGTAGREDLVLLQSGQGLCAVRPKTGELIWNYGDGASTTSSSVLGGQTIYVPSHGLTALTVASSSASQLPVRWRKTDISPGMPSPLYFDRHLYSITGGPILVAADAQTGKLAWRIRLKGTFYASPIAAAGKLYVFNDDGLGQIISLSEKRGTLSSERDFKESIMGTPALSDGSLFIRSDQHVWKIAD
ncbi:MAG TPA: PQQ-binding-like beta-propeller repeat protein [Planctomycetaceae bacterium]|jgi:outer membrane protein assembly factor BamB|nr:PQQ-binding-like beta-propeller repeat protein [Planctomycetaceae bacterium]